MCLRGLYLGARRTPERVISRPQQEQPEGALPPLFVFGEPSREQPEGATGRPGFAAVRLPRRDDWI